ncbi:MAG: hypothetical protein UW76_C0014G0002 [Parcubacteria group bacterium GW2011_GWF2_44_8b]|nr:MAG: hypothetical protein UW76_C0014G0002 [Parcubacteria group bacterium GW2011_GWF2_44_8b]KKT85289.1 MAG: hypothetical protein UW83_C0023G0006 [Parcubacteria group bacterium GW2011_GWD1_44_9]
MVGHIPLEDVIGVRVPNRQQETIVLDILTQIWFYIVNEKDF